eukprot:1879579-Rhodomonas_salina.1
MACESLTTLQAFKTEFLTHFEGTDEGEVTTYLGCKLIRNLADRTILFRQAAYASKNPTALRSVGQAGGEDVIGGWSTAFQS